jgi:hypothetical protein
MDTCEDNKKYFPLTKKWSKISGIILGISILFNTFWPSKNSMIAFYSFKQLDNFNQEHSQETYLTPEQMLNITNKIVKQIDSILNRVNETIKKDE